MSKALSENLPLILAPAGNRESFLAAIAAGADAIYCGLKQFSARMAAYNFSLENLISLSALAHQHNIKVYIAFNSLLKFDELEQAGQMIQDLAMYVKPDALIVADISLLEIARLAGFKGEIHISTLANFNLPSALPYAAKHFDIKNVVLARELDVDEIRQMASTCPPKLSLEVFVHGALCYGVSGRCYWSSYLGGRSGLRGRCVQPCRRVYLQDQKKMKLFSCQDLSIDILTKVLLTIPKVRTLKIEGRKKGPHYVYYTVKAYQILRDLDAHGPNKSQAKKDAMHLLTQALGRPGSHYRFLSQRPQNPIPDKGDTSSGLYIGKLKGTYPSYYLNPIQALFVDDLIRFGTEDESWHSIYKVSKSIPRGGKLFVKIDSRNRSISGTQAFLIDRREKGLKDQIKALEAELEQISVPGIVRTPFKLNLPISRQKGSRFTEINVFKKMPNHRSNMQSGLWINHDTIGKHFKPGHIWWWLDPVCWPNQENEYKHWIDTLLRKGAKHFVLNSVWQMAWFEKCHHLDLWAGPFCNVTNPKSVEILHKIGFKGVIVSPELSRNDYLSMPKHCKLPLGVVVKAFWPLCISRIKSDQLQLDRLFKSPKKEEAWVNAVNDNFWVYPNWQLDLQDKKEELRKMGYQMFVNMIDDLPKSVSLKKRPGTWNWQIQLH